MKAPAFQFYYDRFNSSTSLWDDAQVGQYIRLLMCQANKGYVSSKELKKVVSNDDPDVLSKFKEVEPGKFVNSVLDGILTDRDNYYKKQAENGAKGGRPKNPDETQNKAPLNPNNNPDTNPDETSNTTPTTTPISLNTTKPTTTKKTASPDLFFSDREEITKELNELAGRDFDPHSANSKKYLNPRIKEYGKLDLIDMVRFMVYKRKGGEFEQYLRPETLFNAEKCETYMKAMKDHRSSGKMPKKETGNGLMSAKELFEAAKFARDNKISNL